MEDYRRQIIEEERQRLLREHAAKLLGYLPKVSDFCVCNLFTNVLSIACFVTQVFCSRMRKVLSIPNRYSFYRAFSVMKMISRCSTTTSKLLIQKQHLMVLKTMNNFSFLF